MPAFLTQYQSSSHIQNVSSDYKRAQIYGRHKARMLQNRKCPILTANRNDGTPSIFATAMTQQFHDLSRLRLSLYWRRHSALVCVLYRQSVIASMTWRGHVQIDHYCIDVMMHHSGSTSSNAKHEDSSSTLGSSSTHRYIITVVVIIITLSSSSCYRLTP